MSICFNVQLKASTGEIFRACSPHINSFSGMGSGYLAFTSGVLIVLFYFDKSQAKCRYKQQDGNNLKGNGKIHISIF